jgi:exosortase C (VPDSG-CTERM-specific)
VEGLNAGAMIDHPTAPGPGPETTASGRARLRWFAVFAAGLTLAFAGPLVQLFRYALDTSLHSHAVLIPFISAYLLWLRRGEPWPEPSSSPALAAAPLAVGLFALRETFWGVGAVPDLPVNDRLALVLTGYLGVLWAGALGILGWPLLRSRWFAVFFPVFLLPLPTAVEHAIEVFFQHTSAEAAAWLFTLSGTTMYREGLVFKLPGIEMQVAQECSGIRSSLVLFITSLVAGEMFLRSPWRRLVLTLFVIPLAIVRNGFRVFTIGLLCVHVSPAMIDSAIHKRGGPLFFLLSLIPFVLVLLWLWRGERGRATVGRSQHEN